MHGRRSLYSALNIWLFRCFFFGLLCSMSLSFIFLLGILIGVQLFETDVSEATRQEYTQMTRIRKCNPEMNKASAMIGLIRANCCVLFVSESRYAHSVHGGDITLKKNFNAEDSRGMRKTKIMRKTAGQCVRFPQNAEGLAGL